MLPNNQLSSSNIASDFVVPLRNCELGGIALQDTSAGLDYQVWAVNMINNDVVVSAPSAGSTVLFSRIGATELSLAFDQNMRPMVAYVVGPDTYLWWYDSSVPGIVTVTFENCQNPCVSLDERRIEHIEQSDVIFAYIRDHVLYYRLQRERFLTEHVLLNNAYELRQIGMMKNFRFGFDVLQFVPIDDLALVQSRNPAGATQNYLDLCGQQASYGVRFGDETMATKYEAGQSKLGVFQQASIDTVSIEFLLNADNYNYFMAFYRVWMRKPVPFKCRLVIDSRPLAEYLCQFVPGSLQGGIQGGFSKVSCQLEVKRNRHSLSADQSLVNARN